MNNELNEPQAKVGDIVEAEIVAKGSSGDGIFKIDKYVVFVKDPVEIGYKGKFEIIKVTRRIGFAQLVQKDE